MIRHLYDQLAGRWLRGGSVWIFSDPHFGDPDSDFFRGDSYPGDLELVKRINRRIGKNDTLVMLGDIGEVEFVAKLRGYKVLLLGNHDRGATNYQRRKSIMEDNRLFDEVYEGPLMINDRVILSHEPIDPLPPYLFNVHGHEHGAPNVVDEHHFNVCAEAIGYEPVNLTKLMEKGLLKGIVTIHEAYIETRRG